MNKGTCGNTIKKAFKTTIPVFLGYIVCGIAFGLVLTQNGYPWWLATFMCLTMYAGAAQFAAIPMFAAGTPIAIILGTQFLLNIRHIVYGLPLIEKYKQHKKIRPYLIFGLTDETFSLLTTVEPPENCDSGQFYAAVTAFDQFYWVLGSTIGALAGAYIPFDLTGVDFALTALFAVLTIDQFQKFFSKNKTKNQDAQKETK